MGSEGHDARPRDAPVGLSDRREQTHLAAGPESCGPRRRRQEPLQQIAKTITPKASRGNAAALEQQAKDPSCAVAMAVTTQDRPR